MLKINKCMKNVNFKISDSTKKFLFAVALTFSLIPQHYSLTLFISA